MNNCHSGLLNKMIRISRINPNPVHTIPYEYPERRGKVASASFPIFRAKGSGIPSALGTMIVMSDLQGREPGLNKPVETRRLLGEVVAEEIQLLSELGEIPSARTIGLLLAGDLFVTQDLSKRGGNGDVRHVWQCFRDRFKWVSGIAGNHDLFGKSVPPSDNFLSEPHIHYLDSFVVDLDGLRIGGISGIIGKPRKPFRKNEQNFLEAIASVADQNPDIIILHEGPSGMTPDRGGNNAVRDLLERLHPMLVVCGHCHWEECEHEELSNGTQILNAEARAYIIENGDTM